MRFFRALAALGVLGFWPAASVAGPILGTAPSYAWTSPSAVANSEAIDRRLWMPGLDDGYNPQGLTAAGGALYVAAYRSEAQSVHRGPCRVFRVDPESGAATGHVDVPAPCGHAGGLAVAGDGRLYLADTRDLFAIDLADGFAGAAPPVRHWPLGPGLRGALAASDRGAIWIGTYDEDRPGRLFRFEAALLGGLAPGAALLAEQASAALTIPSYAQGAAFAPDGKLWVSRSDTLWGELVRINMKNGVTERSFATAPGAEGIAFGPDGRLWTVSEAGVRHYYHPALALMGLPFYPLIVSLDPARLE